MCQNCCKCCSNCAAPSKHYYASNHGQTYLLVKRTVSYLCRNNAYTIHPSISARLTTLSISWRTFAFIRRGFVQIHHWSHKLSRNWGERGNILSGKLHPISGKFEKRKSDVASCWTIQDDAKSAWSCSVCERNAPLHASWNSETCALVRCFINLVTAGFCRDSVNLNGMCPIQSAILLNFYRFFLIWGKREKAFGSKASSKVHFSHNKFMFVSTET